MGCSGSPPATSSAAPRQDEVLEAREVEREASDEPEGVADEASDETEAVVAIAPAEDMWLRDLLAAHPKKFGALLDDPARYRLQILVTVIPPKGSEGAAMVEHRYRVDAEYVYPASAIKTFAAVGALRVLEELRARGHRVGLDTPLAFCEGATKHCIAEDISNRDSGMITVGHEIRKMQLVSNNVAFNRLYELVGHQQINEMMWSLGFSSVRIQHRMYGVQDPLVQRTTPRVELRPRRGKAVELPARVSELPMPDIGYDELRLGIAYIDEDGQRVDEPLDFSTKNYVSIRDLHRLTLAIARPELPGMPDLGLSTAAREHLVRAMADNPSESQNPVYPELENGLRYKTMIGGIQKELALERIFYMGKAGRAYGFHLDSAYIQDLETKRAMAVTVVVYANENGVLNDNNYEYDGVTRPLLRNLGQVLARAVLVDGGGT